MLGGIKINDGAERVSLFRILARRWKPVVPLGRDRVALSSMLSADERPKQTRAWISKPRDIYAHQQVGRRKSKTGWNPWLWVK